MPDSIRLTDNARRLLEKRYLKRAADGYETASDMFRRVAASVAAAELKYDPAADIRAKEQEFYQAMAGLEFLPNSPALLNASRGCGQLSACFALPVEDSVEAIFEAVKRAAIVHQKCGGTGFSFSRIRPAGDIASGHEGVAAGPVAFMPAFSLASSVIRQGGVRQGCNIGILLVNHPDIKQFIAIKDDPLALTNFCISVAVTTDFMEAVIAGRDYPLVNPRTGQETARLPAREVFDAITRQSWKTGDPGLIFIDRINRDNPTPALGPIEAVTSCAEQPLLAYESCTMGSINLARMLKDDGQDHLAIDYDKLRRTVQLGVNFLDNAIDVTRYPLPQVKSASLRTRKIGLSVMGYADMLVRLGIPYDSEAALDTIASFMGFITDEAHRASARLAEVRGAFPAFPGSRYDVAGGPRLRNASCTTIAPTGSVSLIAGCNNGIEPFFSMVFVRNILDGERLLEVNPYFETAARQGGFYSAELLQELVAGGDLDEITSVPGDIKRVFVTTNKVKPEWHVRTQATFQRHIDGAVAKMVNVPHDITPADIGRIFLLGYREGVKGVTAYREGSREIQSLCNDAAGRELVEAYLAAHP